MKGPNVPKKNNEATMVMRDLNEEDGVPLVFTETSN